MHENSDNNINSLVSEDIDSKVKAVTLDEVIFAADLEAKTIRLIYALEAELLHEVNMSDETKDAFYELRLLFAERTSLRHRLEPEKRPDNG